jgi:GNAT superfamily N-acetyltransferase
MSEGARAWVEYPAVDPADAPVVIEHVHSSVVDDDFTRGVIRAFRDAYLPQYGGVQLPASTIREAYNPDDDALVAKRRDKIIDCLQSDDSEYWVVRGDEPDVLRGLIRTMRGNGKTYIGDVVVPPPWRQGIGRRLVHAPFRYGGFAPTNSVELDGFEGSSVNEWYLRLGFAPRHISGQLAVSDRSMLMRRYEITSYAGGIGALLGRLEREDPALTESKLRYTN